MLLKKCFDKKSPFLSCEHAKIYNFKILLFYWFNQVLCAYLADMMKKADILSKQVFD